MRVRIRYIIYAVQSKLAAGYDPGSKCSTERLSERFLFGMKKIQKTVLEISGRFYSKNQRIKQGSRAFSLSSESRRNP
jgi:hypothetical protein